MGPSLCGGVPANQRGKAPPTAGADWLHTGSAGRGGAGGPPPPGCAFQTPTVRAAVGAPGRAEREGGAVSLWGRVRSGVLRGECPGDPGPLRGWDAPREAPPGCPRGTSPSASEPGGTFLLQRLGEPPRRRVGAGTAGASPSPGRAAPSPVTLPAGGSRPGNRRQNAWGAGTLAVGSVAGRGAAGRAVLPRTLPPQCPSPSQRRAPGPQRAQP